MIASRVAALNNLLRSCGAEAEATQAHSFINIDPRATQAHFPGFANPATDELGVWNEKALAQALFAREGSSSLVKSGMTHDTRAGRFTHSEDSIRAGGDQGVKDEEGKDSDDDD